MGLNYDPIFRHLWTKVHQITSADAGEIVVCNAVFPIVDILFHSGDIRDRSAKSSEIAPKGACFSASIFFGGRTPKFWTYFLKLHPFPIMWQSFAAIGRETAEISR